LPVEKRSQNVWATTVIFQTNSHKENNHPMGENSPTLVTLVSVHISKTDPGANDPVLSFDATLALGARSPGHNIDTLYTPFEQGCQMVYFQTKNPNLGKFWSALE
jgi:hypothetical protein